MKIIRRETLARGGQAAAATPPNSGDAAPCGEPDAELIALGRQHQDWWAHMCRLVKEEDRLLSAGTDAERSEIAAQVSQGWDKSSEMERRIAAIPANTFAGIAIKLRIATEDMNEEDMRRPTNANLESALADAERLAGATLSTVSPETTSEDPFEALAAEWAEQKAECQRLAKAEEEAGVTGADFPSDAAQERLGEIEQRIAVTPTTTILGIATKLRAEVFAEVEYQFTTTEHVIKTALAGAEYLLAQSRKAA